jgi:hypothetical protein
LWHQLLVTFLADLFQTCTNDQAECFNGRKEKIIPATILPGLWPFGSSMASTPHYLADFFQTYNMIRHDTEMVVKEVFLQSFSPEL